MLFIEFEQVDKKKKMSFTMHAYNHQDTKKTEIFEGAMTKAYDEAKAAIFKYAVGLNKGDVKMQEEAQKEYKTAFLTLISLAHAASDKGLYLGYTKEEFNDLLNTFEDAMSKEVIKVFKEVGLNTKRKWNA